VAPAEVEANGDSKSTNIRGTFFLSWFVGLLGASTRDFYPALAALVGPVQNISNNFFLQYTF
jgi:hypothetical protein